MVTLTKTNAIIHHFLNCSNSFSNDVQTRLKLSSNIKEFDAKLNKNVSLFVSLSNSRYKSVKSGNKLNTVINNQKKKYNQLSYEIMTDDFYNNEDIRNEKDKIKMNVTNSTKAKAMNKIRRKILLLTKDNHLTKYLDTIKSSQHLTKHLGISNQFFSSKKRSMSEVVKSAEIIEDKSERDHQESREVVLKKNIQLVTNVVINDNKVINQQFNEYCNYLNSIQELSLHKENENDEKQNLKHSKTDPKLFFSSNKLKLLSYNNNSKVEVKKEKPVDLLIDLQKIFKYTKIGKRAIWQLNQLITPNQMINTTNSLRKSSTFISYPNEKCNTLYKIKTEAKNLMQIEDKMNKKRARFNYLFKERKGNLPWISKNEITDIYNDKNEYKTTRSLSFSFKNMDNNLRVNNKSDINNKTKQRKTEEEKVFKHSLEPLYDRLEKIYANKINEREPQVDKETPTQKELQTMHSFLVNINKLPRTKQLYIDEYSRRSKYNETISNFSKSLGNTFHNKKSINCLVKGYIFQKEKRNSTNDLRSANKLKTKKEQVKEAQIAQENKSYLPLDFKFVFKDNEGETAGKLGNDNGESNYIPLYLRVKGKRKEEKSNEEYEESKIVRDFVENKNNNKLKKEINKALEINKSVMDNNNQINRKGSLYMFNLTQNSFVKINNNNIDQKKS